MENRFIYSKIFEKKIDRNLGFYKRRAKVHRKNNYLYFHKKCIGRCIKARRMSLSPLKAENDSAD